LINLKDEINGISEERLEESEPYMTEINNLIYAAATVITETFN
jgi:hypothetical protein